MFSAAAKALAQMFSPSFRTILLKSAGLALLLLVVLGIILQRLFSWLTTYGGTWVETTSVNPGTMTINIFEWMLVVLASVGVIAGVIFLMPAVTALVAGVFADDIAQEVETAHYPNDPPGKPLPLPISMFEAVKTALLSLVIYLCAVPFLLFAGLGAVIFFFATAYLLGREYFHLAAMRFHPPAEARAMRKRHAGTAFQAGLFIAAFVSIPILNLAAPLFATALMVHIHKRVTHEDSPRVAADPTRGS